MAPRFSFVHKGPREDWYCSCTQGNGAILRPGVLDKCETCGVVAPFLEWDDSSQSESE